MSLLPVPGTDHPDQLIIGDPGVPVIVSGQVLQERPERGAARRGIQRHAGREPGRRARIPAREDMR